MFIAKYPIRTIPPNESENLKKTTMFFITSLPYLTEESNCWLFPRGVCPCGASDEAKRFKNSYVLPGIKCQSKK